MLSDEERDSKKKQDEWADKMSKIIVELNMFDWLN